MIFFDKMSDGTSTHTWTEINCKKDDSCREPNDIWVDKGSAF